MNSKKSLSSIKRIFVVKSKRLTRLEKTKRARKSARIKKAKLVDETFMSLIHSLVGEYPEKEYRFHKIRKWRIDYAYPKYKVAIECDGGLWIAGRHARPIGIIKDNEKINHLSLLGWVTFRFTPQQIVTREAVFMIRDCIERIRGEIGLKSNHPL